MSDVTYGFILEKCQVIEWHSSLLVIQLTGHLTRRLTGRLMGQPSGFDLISSQGMDYRLEFPSSVQT
jgi:hypothetical protein